MPCPAGVNIPKCFIWYNSKYVFTDKQTGLMYILKNDGITRSKPTLAYQCVECGKCVGKCPQHLSILDFLKDVADDMEGLMTKLLI